MAKPITSNEPVHETVLTIDQDIGDVITCEDCIPSQDWLTTLCEQEEYRHLTDIPPPKKCRLH